MDAQVRKLFERYEQLFRKSLAGDADMDEVASVYASAFIAASPAGVMVGNNDDQFKQAMEQGYAHYRAIGTKEMRIRDVRISPIDEHHCVAHVAWTSIYARKDGPDRFRRPLPRAEAGRRAQSIWVGIRRRAGGSEKTRHRLKSAWPARPLMAGRRHRTATVFRFVAPFPVFA